MNRSTRLATLLTAILLLGPIAARAADQSVWPLTPYHVTVYVAATPVEPLTERMRANLLSGIATRLDAVVGAPWNLTVAAAPPAIQSAMLYDIRAMQAKDVPFKTPEPDKILLLAVTPMPGGVTVTARDFDVRTRTLGASVTRRVWQMGSLCDASIDALLTAFAPLARIDRIEVENKEGVAVLRVKAAGLPTRDPNLKLVRPGDIFRPIVRQNNRDNSLKQISYAKWSYCLIEKTTPEEARARIYTGAKGEVAAKGRGRSEPLALRVLSPGGSTTVTLQTRVAPERPMAGYDVYAYSPGKKDVVNLVGQSDRQGRLVVPPIKDSPIRLLLVKNGSALLVKLPVMPGLEPALSAGLPNDDQRLEAEGFNTALQEELYDLIARRRIFARQIRLRLEAKDVENASKLLDELRALPTAQYFITRMTKEQEKLLAVDRSNEKKIKTFFDSTRKLVDQHLDPSFIEEVDGEVRDAKAAAKGVAEK